ncbi:hypothetical protein CSOJ01_16052, partial [Colletotrichum sojae]
MEPFVHDAQYSIIICTSCKYAVVANEAAAHLRNHHGSISTKDRVKVAKVVGNIPDIIQSQDELQSFPYPAATVEPIGHIAPPQTDGLRCQACRYVCRRVRNMQEHCRVEHGWKNEWEKGGNVRKKAREARAVPWTTGVPCQRFFPSRAGSRWFEVGRGHTLAGNSGSAEAGTDDTAWFVALHDEQEQRFETGGREEVSALDEKLEPNGWLYRVGWTKDLEGLNKARLQEATRPIEDDEETLRVMWAVFDAVADKARATAAPHKVGHDVLFEAERREMGQKPVRPFDNRMEADTWQRYKEVWRKMICIWFRTDEWADEDRPPYRFTVRQGELWDAFTGRVETDISSTQGGREEEVERMCLDAVMAFIEEPYRQSQRESAIICALAVLGIREDGGWHQATEYTTNYSAVIKVAKMFVVYQAWLERQDEVAEMAKTKGAEVAYDEATSV